MCHRPDPATSITFAYFHFPPFVNVSEGESGTIGPGQLGGIEPNINKEFAKKYNFKMEFLDAEYVWGKFVPETGRLVVISYNAEWFVFIFQKCYLIIIRHRML